MKVLETDYKKFAKIKITEPEDYLTLLLILDKETYISGETYRVIKYPEKEKVKVWLKIKVEEVIFEEKLKVRGKIVEGPEEIEKGYHTFSLDIGTVVTIEKDFTKEEIEELLKSEKKYKPFILVSMDNYECSIALIKTYDYYILTTIENEGTKGDPFYEEKFNKYLSEIAKKVKEYVEIYDPFCVIIASPAFWKDLLMEKLKDLKVKIEKAEISYGGVNGIKEFLKRKEYLKILEKMHISKIQEFLDEFFRKYERGEAVCGNDVFLYLDAVEKVLFTTNFLKENWGKEEIKRILKKKFLMVSSETEQGEIVDKMGGIIGICYYRVL